MDSASIRALEIAHVLFVDIVAYSTLTTDQQQRLLEGLNDAVRNTPEFTRASAENQLIRLPTGDGMALVFFGDPEAPVRCALELSQALRVHPEIKLRMGIHTGPVYRVADINANLNVAGGGINVAQRVMDCGDPGHILVSKATADVLCEVGGWKESLKDLGELKVKHGLRLHLFEVLKQEAGQRHRPKRPRLIRARRMRRALATVLAVAVVAGGVSGWLIHSRKVQALGEADTVILAEFENKTGDPVFDDTLKTALNVALNQSPFLNVLPQSKVTATLKLMALPANATLTPDVAREIGQRAGSKAYIAGSVANLGSQYVLGLRAVNCRTGDILAQEQVTAAIKEKVLDALGAEAAKLRGELGESLASVHKFDVPLLEATTSSLEALKAYSLGQKARRERGFAASLPYFERAIQIDPSFAVGNYALGIEYENLRQVERASEYFTKAFQLREHASEREKLVIAAAYYENVTGELNKGIQALQEETESYPHDMAAYDNLGDDYTRVGQYEKAMDAYRQCIRLSPENGFLYPDLGRALVASQRLDEAQQTLAQPEARKSDNSPLHEVLYALAFLNADSKALAEQQQWFASRRGQESNGPSLVADTEAYAGYLSKAQELTNLAVQFAISADSRETGAIWQENAALREAAFGNAALAKRTAADGLKLAPTSLAVNVEAALTYAMAGDTTRAESMVRDLNKRFPLDTQVQSLWLPAIRAQVLLEHNNPAEAVENLQLAVPVEFARILFLNSNSCLYPTYLRGKAYLAERQGQLAAAEFQKILDHGGIVWNCWTGALARLGVARANALQSRTSQGADADAARVKALAAYKDLLALWKDADPDIPILKQAKAEYAKLQ